MFTCTIRFRFNVFIAVCNNLSNFCFALFSTFVCLHFSFNEAIYWRLNINMFFMSYSLIHKSNTVSWSDKFHVTHFHGLQTEHIVILYLTILCIIQLWCTSWNMKREWGRLSLSILWSFVILVLKHNYVLHQTKLIDVCDSCMLYESHFTPCIQPGCKKVIELIKYLKPNFTKKFIIDHRYETANIIFKFCNIKYKLY